MSLSERRVFVAGLTAFQAVLLIVIALTALRLVVLFLSDLELGADEAQYWSWSLEPAFGYFSKPPMIAWIIGLTTSACGVAEPCVRLASPLLYAATSLGIFALARMLYDERTGFWAAVVFATLPAVFFSSALISTDVPLLVFWTFALYACVRWLDAPASERLAWAAATGALIGLGFLAKYAMGYFALCFALFALVEPEARRRLLSRDGLLAALAALVVAAPNLIWNATHSFATFTHTAANANWGGELFNLDKLEDFAVAQIGIFGPILMAALIWRLVASGHGTANPRRHADTMMICFALPVLAVGLVQAFVSRANANWAAPAYVAATILVVAWLVRRAKLWPLWITVALHTSIGVALGVFALNPSLVEAVGQANAFKRLHGWNEAAEAVIAETRRASYTAILFDDRETMAEFLYYARDVGVPMKMWLAGRAPQNHFEMAEALTPDLAGRVLYVIARNREPSDAIARAFASRESVGALNVQIGGGKTRPFRFYALTGYRPAP